MEYSSAQALISDIKKDKILPVYVCHGTEPFFIDQIVDYASKHLLSEAEQAFNMSVLYGRDVNAKQILDHARQFPMMATRRVVIVKEAQFMRDLKALESYMSQPSPQTVLVIAHKKKIDGRITWVKKAKKSDDIGLLASDSVPEYKMSKWVSDYATSQKINISPGAVDMLCQYLGTDLKKVSNELEKVKLHLKDGEQLTEDQVRTYIGISRDYDIYALLKALSQGNIPLVQQITTNIESNIKAQPLQMIIPGLAGYFEKVLIVSQHLNKDDRSLGSMIGAYSSFVKEYKDMAKRYGYNRLVRVYSLLVEADANAKGVDRRNQDGIFQELMGKITLLQII